MQPIWTRRVLTLVLAAVACAAVLAACGSSKSGGSSASAAASGIKFSDCMRSHGVPNFPDPGSGGGVQIGEEINKGSPVFQSAMNACSKLMPGGGPLHGKPSEARKLSMLHLAQCIRRHGFSAFPDPTATPPSPPAGGGIAFGGPGSFIAVPQSVMNAPGFQQAAAACRFPGGGRPGAGKKSFAPG